MSSDNKNKNSISHKNSWNVIGELEEKIIFSISEKYKTFLNASKTEREAFSEIKKEAVLNGFASFEELLKKGDKLTAESKIYFTNRNKSIILCKLGNDLLETGFSLIASHIDSPRLDLKPNPLYEENDLAFLKTHYYGGIKKYQWTAIPLAIHGVITNGNGEKITITVGEDEGDPIFYITDMLPHLSKDQNEKKLGEAITGEGLNILIGSRPRNSSEDCKKVKNNILDILNSKYQIKESDFSSAELEIVPSFKARDIGFDRSLIAGYGHDDRACAFASLEGFFSSVINKKTQMLYFSDKEETGSSGNTGASSAFFSNSIAELIAMQTDYNEIKLRRSLSKSKVISADVGVPIDPNYPEITDKLNAATIGHGTHLVKYSGVRGKSGSSDANSEYLSEIISIFNKNNVNWQIGEMGKIDQGGGGTIAYILANLNADVIDCGVPVLSMHAPYEAISKADLYMTYRAYKAFLENY